MKKNDPWIIRQKKAEQFWLGGFSEATDDAVSDEWTNLIEDAKSWPTKAEAKAAYRSSHSGWANSLDAVQVDPSGIDVAPAEPVTNLPAEDNWTDEVHEAEVVEDTDLEDAETDLGEADLGELAVLADKWHREAKQHALSAVSMCIKSGQALRQAKELCKVSKQPFMKWVEANTDISQSLANKYMNLANAVDSGQEVESDKSLRVALASIGKPTDGKKGGGKKSGTKTPKPKPIQLQEAGEWQLTVVDTGDWFLSVGGEGITDLDVLSNETAYELHDKLEKWLADLETAYPSLQEDEEDDES